MSVGGLLRVAIMLALVLLVGASLGLALLIAGFQIGLLSAIDILFYRGLCLIALAMPIVFIVLWAGLARFVPADVALRDALSAAIVSAALNVSFLIVVPVTVDRSISIFILGQMAESPAETTKPEAMSALFTSVYVGTDRQIERRLREQTVSGNVAALPGGTYRLTGRGRAVVAVSRVIARLFDSHAGILAHRTPPDREPSVR